MYYTLPCTEVLRIAVYFSVLLEPTEVTQEGANNLRFFFFLFLLHAPPSSSGSSPKFSSGKY